MSEELKRRGRVAAALFAGPAVTVGMLGVGAAPAMAQDEADAGDTATEEEVEGSQEGDDTPADEETDGDDDNTEDENSSSDSDEDQDDDSENGADEDQNGDSDDESNDGSENGAGEDQDDSGNESEDDAEESSESSGDGEDTPGSEDPANEGDADTESEEFSTLQEDNSWQDTAVDVSVNPEDQDVVDGELDLYEVTQDAPASQESGGDPAGYVPAGDIVAVESISEAGEAYIPGAAESPGAYVANSSDYLTPYQQDDGDGDDGSEDDAGNGDSEDSADEGSGADFSVDGSVVTAQGFPEGVYSVEIAAPSGETTSASLNEDGSLSVDIREEASLLDLEPGENTLTFSWDWFDENAEQQEDSTEVTVTLEGPETGEVNFSVDDGVVTGEGFPEGVFSVGIEAPSGQTTSAQVDEDGTLTWNAVDAVDILDLGFGEQALTFSWNWNDEAFGQQEDSAEVAVTALPPLETGEDVDAEEIVAGLVGDDTGVEGVTPIGDNVQVGQFAGWDALGIPAGVALSTGDLQEAWAAITGRGSGSLGQDLEGPGDDDLDAIAGEGAETQDAGGLEFSFVPEENYVQFSYVFASEEYAAATDYNDVFAFLVNGENHAVFENAEGETLPVSIDTINHETNPEFFNDNQENEDGERPHDSNVAGFTTVMTFTAPVNPGEQNTLKLVTGDTNDGVYDSMVFLQSGSFEQITGPMVSGAEEATEQGEPVSGDFELETNIEDPEWTIDVTDGINEDAGELEIDGTSWTFTPAENFTGEASFTFTANDGQLSTVPATITITVGDEEDDGGDEGSGGDDGDDSTSPEDDDEGTGDEGDGVALSVDSNEVYAGDQVTLVGEGFEAGEDVVFDLNPELGTFVADDEGVVTAEVTIPEDTEAGEHTITATGQSSDLSESVSITVIEPEDSGAGDEGEAEDSESEPAGGTTGGDQTDGESGDGAPAAEADSEELAATGFTAGNVGMVSGLLLLIGGGLAALGFKNRLGRKNADA